MTAEEEGFVQALQADIEIGKGMLGAAMGEIADYRDRLIDAEAEVARLQRPCGWPHCEPAKQAEATIARLREALDKEHRGSCPTVEPDGKCGGCSTADALAATEPA